MRIPLRLRMDTLLDTAKRTLSIEIAALQALHEELGKTADFSRFVKAIAAAKGRLLVTGIGKSALVAQKIVATLNSTGTPALFLHAADAIHGDLGMLLPYDLVLCLSKSGTTPEIQLLVSLIKNFGNPLAAMTANRASFLAKQADFVLYTPIEQEADLHNLAPTTSTTAQMALGDALATALMAFKGFSPDDFAKFHPGGALGKQLYLRVRDLYIHHGKPAVGPDALLATVILEMTAQRLGATAVTDEQGVLLGIITDGDLRRMLNHQLQPNAHLCAADIMNRTPKTIGPEAFAVDALALMRQCSISQLLVMDGDVYVGMVHLHDLVREGLI